MLFLNLKRAFELRGIDNASAYMLKMGISRPTITRLLRGDKSGVSYGHLEKICALLNCTPNDLFEWKPSGDSNLAENHALYALRRNASARSLKEMVKDIPLEKMSEMETLFDDLKKE